MKKVIAMLVILCIALSPTGAFAKDDISIFVNGNELECDVAPYIKNGRTMVPMRAIFEALGASVDWNNQEKRATAVRDDIKIAVAIGAANLYKNDKEIVLDAPAEIKDGRTMMPVRAVSEAFGCSVTWIEDTRTVEISGSEKLTKSQALLLDAYLYEDREGAKKKMRVLNESIEVEDYTLTVNEVMGDAMQFYLSISITAKNPMAQRELTAREFDWIKIMGSKGDGKWFGADTGSKSEMYGDTRIFVASCKSSLYGSMPLVQVGWKRFDSKDYVEFELDEVLGEIKLQLKGLGNDESYIILQPMRIEIMVPTNSSSDPYCDIDTFFRMRDGKIVTLSQLTGANRSSSMVEHKLYKHILNTKSVLKLEDFESVIVKGNEYSIDNPPEYKAVEIPEGLKPFIINNSQKRMYNYVHYSIDVDTLVDKLKTEITDRSETMVEFVYFGKTYTLEKNSFYAYVDGDKKYQLFASPYWSEDGKIWVTHDLLTKVMGIKMEYPTDKDCVMYIP